VKGFDDKYRLLISDINLFGIRSMKGLKLRLKELKELHDIEINRCNANQEVRFIKE